jgi:transcription-repair coupling factor (superfamily II helicase)
MESMMLWFELSSSARALAYAQHFVAKGGLIITETPQAAQKIAREMSFYEPGLKHRIQYLPDNETLPFDLQKAPAIIISERATVFLNLAQAGENNDQIMVVSASNSMRLCAAFDFWTNNHCCLTSGSSIQSALGNSDFALSFSKMGYEKVSQVKNPGTWAARGQVLDLYPVGLSHTDRGLEHLAVRIRLNEQGQILSIAKLDTLTQESSPTQIAKVDVFPNREYDITREMIEGFRQKSFDQHEDPRSVDSYKIISAGQDHPELSSWIGLDGLDYTNPVRIAPMGDVIFDGWVEGALARQWQLVRERNADIAQDTTRICPPIEASWITPEQLSQDLHGRTHCRLRFEPEASGMKRLGTLTDALALLKNLIDEELPILFVMKSQVRMRHIQIMCKMSPISRASVLVDSFKTFYEDPKGLAITQGDLTDGYICKVRNYRVITETEIFGTSIESSFDDELGEHQRRVILQGLGGIEVNDPIVHALEGVGRFLGFETLDMGDGLQDMLKIGFAKEASLFVRVNELDMISRYNGADPEKAPLSKINDGSWLKGLQVAQDSAFGAAASLIKIRNDRMRTVGIVLSPPDEKYDAFCETFIYEETRDQNRAIADIISDLTTGKPMDRLICGDVGFGKTEVAMRAAFLMASQGYQVAFLAPTTILAEQHYQSICKRFEDTSIKVLLANQKTPASELKQIKKGEALIVIGTHRILQADIIFSRLGLIIVDEEHKFGVRQKEALRTMRGNKHMLAMAATPIPRTLGMAISGIRDISIIATPPARRLSVRTLVRRNAESVIREAISRELAREGQIFFLHNRIESMDECVDRLLALSPKARIRKIHGQMSEGEMTEIMFSFRKHEFDVLVCTTVIEVGIDVPNANTLIVEDAGNLGLAQLHQLRGRVGRSNRQAYTYLLCNENQGPVAIRRMQAMERSTNLGEGVLIARHDMEIRGIGEILGEEQSGHIHTIGFTLYMRLLEQAIKAIDSGEDHVANAVLMGRVVMPVYGKIPTDFMPECGDRLAWYQRLMSSDTPDELEQNLTELEDMYGYIPKEIYELKASILKHLAAKTWGISSMKSTGKDVSVECNVNINTDNIHSMLALSFPGRFTLSEKSRTFVIQNASVDEVSTQVFSSTVF